MFVSVDLDVQRPRHAIAPFEFDVFDDARPEPVPPAWIDQEWPAYARVLEDSLVAKSGLLEQLAPRSVRVRLSLIEAAGYGLPEVEWLRSPQQQNLAVVAMYDNED